MLVADSERITRFLFFKKWYAKTTARVKPEAFVPYRYVELSVSCTEALDESGIWKVGMETAFSRRDKPRLHGRADLRAKVVRDEGLDIQRDDNPRYHANILGWTGERSAQLSKAQGIAAAAKLILIEEESISPNR